MPETSDGYEYDLGVLFVHGIGNQTLGSTLTAFGTPLVEWLRARAERAGAHVELGKTVLSVSGDEPASSELTIVATGKKARRWLLAESWWAQAFPVAQFQDVAEWSLLIVPWTIGTHFARRWARTREHRRLGSRISAVAALVSALTLSPAVLLVLAILLLLGRIPWPQLQNAVAKIQLAIGSSLGDSYMLLVRPIEAAAIRTRVRRDLDWMLSTCRHVAVMAHSQGGAIACQVLSTGPSRKQLLVTFGSGLRKLEELDAARRRGGILKGALLSVAGLFVAGLMIAVAPQVAYQAYLGTASPTSVVTLAVFAAVGMAVGIAGIQDFMHAAEPFSLRKIAFHLGVRSVEWQDMYSSSDPVPNGTVHDDGEEPPTSTEVVNLRSVLRDHTNYWQNRDEFVALVAEKLLAFDNGGVLEAEHPDAVSFLRAQRSVRVRVLQVLRWATTGCIAALIVQYRSDWFAVAAWVSHRALAWTGSFVGYTPLAMSTPEAAVWSRSVGWLTAVLVSCWVTRTLWVLWNGAAMEDAQRGIWRVREPLGVLLGLFFQLLLTAVAVFSFGYAFGVAIVGILPLLIVVVVAQRQHPVPRVASAITPDEPSSSAFVVWHALKKLFLVGVTISTIPVAFITGALRAQEYLASRIGTGASWAVATVLILAGAVGSVAVTRATLATLKEN